MYSSEEGDFALLLLAEEVVVEDWPKDLVGVGEQTNTRTIVL